MSAREDTEISTTEDTEDTEEWLILYFMTRDTSEKVVQALVSAAGAVNDSLFLVRPELPVDAYEEYKKRCGQVMAAIYLDLIKLVVTDYPDLDPGRPDPRDMKDN